MSPTLLAFALVQAAVPEVPAAQAQTPQPQIQNVQGWQVGGTSDGCIAHAAYSGGTVLTMFALPDRDGIGFLLQNPGWRGLRDGAVYPLQIRFENGNEWPVPAVARLDIDADGPGLFFAVQPGDGEAGLAFISEFAAASGMHIAAQGMRVESLALSGNDEATAALARCLGEMIGGGRPEAPFDDEESAASAIRI